MKKKTPHYSGDASKDFWRRVNAIKGPDSMGLYALGCVLQTAEHHALAALEEEAYGQVTV